MITMTPINMIKTRTGTTREKFSNRSYEAQRTQDLNDIKQVLLTHNEYDLFFGKGWIKLNGKTYNGISKRDIDKILKEKENNTCNFANNIV